MTIVVRQMGVHRGGIVVPMCDAISDAIDWLSEQNALNSNPKCALLPNIWGELYWTLAGEYQLLASQQSAEKRLQHHHHHPIATMAPQQKGFSWSNIAVGSIMNIVEVGVYVFSARG